jgi:hypothetical protein
VAPRKQFLLRIDPALWRELERWAADDLRSVNAQVEWLLRDVVRTRRGGSAASGASRGGTPNEGGAAGGGGPERPPAAPPEAAPRDFDDH